MGAPLLWLQVIRGEQMDYFNLKFHGASIKNEIFAGITMFIAMSYILVVAPTLLSQAGMPYDGVFLSTVLVSGVVTIISSLYTKLPIAFAPGLGILSTFFSYAVGDEALDYSYLLLAIYVSGILFLMLSKFGVYQIVMDVMDLEFRRMLMSGIGLALFLYGISTTGLLQKKGSIYLLGSVDFILLLITFISLLSIYVTKKKGLKSHMLYGLSIAYVLGMIYDYYLNGYQAGISVSNYLYNIFNTTHELSDMKKITFCFPDITPIISNSKSLLAFLNLVFVFSITHFFDAIGTNSSVFEAIDLYIDQRIKDDNSLKKTITIDGVGNVLSGLFGISTVTTYAESFVGVLSGGKTGVTALVTGICFLSCIFISPLFTSIPTIVAAPVLIYVGLNLLKHYRDFHKRKPIINLYGILLIIYLGITFKTGTVITYGLFGYTLLTAFVERRKPVKHWWIVLIFMFLQLAPKLYL